MKFTSKKISHVFLPVVSLLIFLGMIAADITFFTSERPIAIVRRFKPEVIVQNMDEGKMVNLSLSDNKGEKLFSGDTLSTGDDALALVVFMDASVAKVKSNSVLVIYGESGPAEKNMSSRINLDQGEVFFNVEPQSENEFEVATSRSLASVKGTDFGSRDNGYFWVQNGQVDVTATNSGQTVSLFEKMYAQVDDQGNNIDTGTLTDEEISALGEGYDQLENDLIQKELKLQFRDQNGQLREITIDIFEEDQN